MRRRFLPLFCVAGPLLFLATPAWGGTPTEQLRGAVEKVIQILDDPALRPDAKVHQRQAAVQAAVVDLFDYPEISKRALARHWRELSEPEQQEFVALFRALLERTYLPQIRLYQGERVQFVGEFQDGDLASVQTRLFTRRRAQEVPVTFRLHRQGERWLVYDVSVEGISLVSNYRAQFDQIIQRASAQGLLARIKQKLATSDGLDERK